MVYMTPSVSAAVHCLLLEDDGGELRCIPVYIVLKCQWQCGYLVELLTSRIRDIAPLSTTSGLYLSMSFILRCDSEHICDVTTCISAITVVTDYVTKPEAPLAGSCSQIVLVFFFVKVNYLISASGTVNNQVIVET